VLLDKKNELDSVSQFYVKAEKEVFDEIHAQALEMKNKCFEKSEIQIDYMKKYFSNEFFDSLTNILATSKNFHKMKFKKTNYSNISSKLSSYINDRLSLKNNNEKMIVKKMSSSKSILLSSSGSSKNEFCNVNTKSEINNATNNNDINFNTNDTNRNLRKKQKKNNNVNVSSNNIHNNVINNKQNNNYSSKSNDNNNNNINEPPLAEKSKNLNLSETSKFKKSFRFSEKKEEAHPIEKKSSTFKSNLGLNKIVIKQRESLKEIVPFKSAHANFISVMDNPPLFEYYQTEVLLDLKSLRKQKLENIENIENNSKSKHDNNNNNYEITNTNSSNMNLNSITNEDCILNEKFV